MQDIKRNKASGSMIPANLLNLSVTKDETGNLCIDLNCNDHEFDSDLLTDLLEKALETASSTLSPATLH